MPPAHLRQLFLKGAPGVALQSFQLRGIPAGHAGGADGLAGLLTQQGFTLRVVLHARVRPGWRPMVAPGLRGGPAQGLP